MYQAKTNGCFVRRKSCGTPIMPPFGFIKNIVSLTQDNYFYQFFVKHQNLALIRFLYPSNHLYDRFKNIYICRRASSKIIAKLFSNKGRSPRYGNFNPTGVFFNIKKLHLKFVSHPKAL